MAQCRYSSGWMPDSAAIRAAIAMLAAKQDLGSDFTRERERERGGGGTIVP